MFICKRVCQHDVLLHIQQISAAQKIAVGTDVRLSLYNLHDFP